MEEETFYDLLLRYQKGLSNLRENEMVEEFYKQNLEKASVLSFWSAADKHKAKSRMWLGIQQEVFAKKKARWPLVKIAASIIVILAATIMIYQFYFNQEPQLMVKTTAHGQKSMLTLSDGTQVRLNAGSSLTYPDRFGADERRVSLLGEAFFEVVKNPEQPFVVSAKDMKITVLGTSFNVAVYSEEEHSVSLVTGKVQVSSGDKELLLRPGQQAFIPQGQQGEIRIQDIDLHQAIAWKDGVLIFRGAPLEEVVMRLSRWYNVTIEYNKEWPKDCRFSGEYNNETLSNVLESFHFIYGLEYEFKSENRVVLTGNPCQK